MSGTVVEMNAAASMPAAVETTIGEIVPQAGTIVEPFAAAPALITNAISYKTASVVTFSAVAPYTSPAPVTAMMPAMGSSGVAPLPLVSVETAGDAPTTYTVVSPPAYLESPTALTTELMTKEPISTTTMDVPSSPLVTYVTGPLSSITTGEAVAVLGDDETLGYSAPAMAYKPVTYYAAPPNDPKSGAPSPVITYSAMPAQTTASTVGALPTASEPLTTAALTKQTTYKVAAPIFYSIANAAPLPAKVATSNVIVKTGATTTMGTGVAEPVAVTAAVGSAASEPKSTETKDSQKTIAKVVRRKIGCC
jgi:hypothetical protein